LNLVPSISCDPCEELVTAFCFLLVLPEGFLGAIPENKLKSK
jgi:hypothetical protein